MVHVQLQSNVLIEKLCIQGNNYIQIDVNIKTDLFDVFFSFDLQQGKKTLQPNIRPFELDLIFSATFGVMSSHHPKRTKFTQCTKNISKQNKNKNVHVHSFLFITY